MLTSQCVMGTSLLVSTSAVSCYLALHWATCGHEIKCLAIQKCSHFASSLC